jgi:hypothetical protein
MDINKPMGPPNHAGPDTSHLNFIKGNFDQSNNQDSLNSRDPAFTAYGRKSVLDRELKGDGPPERVGAIQQQQTEYKNYLQQQMTNQRKKTRVE